ncbi:pyridoxal phosphate-dependent decarboxylase family protein [Amycolatopsis keratiniphila]|uniref:Aspartate aminotransferase family protein n=1 Tax=Amycolatopsis keratiniphila subsp. keratiniphila TaxID=227715 RepID=A0A1W2LXI2_9PSEU|nr:pyridoxal-dependent decarboxylase [Amycolatopsis keratiniphila]ONF71607.1 aspartate aminotransferase family protein [Amycolatopsis keratiniphila subsp. keratiniphila]
MTAREPLAATPAGLETLRELTDITLNALGEGRRRRGGPVPPGGPARVEAAVRARLSSILPREGVGAGRALSTIVRTVAAGAADPADPLCAAHLHGAPLAVAAAADLAASVLNPSLDSWDQAPAAAEIERLVTDEIAGLVYPGHGDADAVVTTGATESNLVALLLVREELGRVQVVCSAEAHHSVGRAAWMLGLPPAIPVPTIEGRLSLDALESVLSEVPGPHFVVATAGTTDRGVIDSIGPMADITERHQGHLHVDAAYGGGLLFSSRRDLLAGLERAGSVALDLHKFGWQPLPAGLLAVRSKQQLSPLSLVADYLNANDDQEAGFPDLLGRSIRTSRRPDALKLAVTFQALGRDGLARLTDRCCDAAASLAGLISARPGLRLQAWPEISTVLFRPVAADTVPVAEGNDLVAGIRRELLIAGTAVLGRATVDGLVWLKLTLLNPEVTERHLGHLLDLVETTTAVPAAA